MGIGKSQVCSWENGRIMPMGITFLKIVEIAEAEKLKNA